MDGAQRMSNILPDNCGREATRESSHCRAAISKSGFPIIQASSCAHHSNALKLPGTTICLPSDQVVQIHNGQGLSNKKNTTNNTLIFERLLHFGGGAEETLSPYAWLSNCNVSVIFLPSLHKNFTNTRS